MDHIKTAEVLAYILDARFGVGNVRFGLSAIADIFPGFGDLIAALLSFYIVYVAIKMNVKSQVIAQMIRNILIVFVVGSVPVIGDLVYILAKVNIRNVSLLKANLPEHIIDAEIV